MPPRRSSTPSGSGSSGELCAEIAGRVAESGDDRTTEVVVVTERFDVVAALAADDPAPVDRRSPCPLRGAGVTWLMAPAPTGRLNAVRLLTIGYALVWIAVRTGHWRDLSRLPARRDGSPSGSST